MENRDRPMPSRVAQEEIFNKVSTVKAVATNAVENRKPGRMAVK